MAVSKKNIFIEAELEWCEVKLEEWKNYVDNNPFDQMRDRVQMKTTKTGVMPIVVASIEQQIKSIRDTLKDVLTLLPELNKMREEDAFQKKTVKGGHDVPLPMRNRQ